MTGLPPVSYLEVEGDAQSIGLAYGRIAANQIGTSLDIFRKTLTMAELSWDTALRRAGDILAQLDHYDSRLASELRAVARGAGIRATEVTLINARREVLFETGRSEVMREEGCTGAVALPSVTQSGHLLHGQNWDLPDAYKDTLLVVHRRPDVGPATLGLFEAGAMARCGLNEHGIGLTGNALLCDHDPHRKGLPTTFIRHRVMSCRSFAQAAQSVMKATHGASSNIMLSDKNGLAVNLEVTPREYFWLKPSNGILAHANHFISPGALSRVFDMGLAGSADSLYRDDRVRDTLEGRAGQITQQTMFDVLADDFATPASVNKPPPPDDPDAGASTVASVVMDVTEGTLSVVPTPYAQSQMVTYSL